MGVGSTHPASPVWVAGPSFLHTPVYQTFRRTEQLSEYCNTGMNGMTSAWRRSWFHTPLDDGDGRESKHSTIVKSDKLAHGPGLQIWDVIKPPEW